MRLLDKRTFPLAALSLALLLLPAAAGAQVDTGSADFTRYVAVGDSLGAGFLSGSLIEDGQRNSYPSLIYQQVNGSSAGFEQPLVSAPGIPGVLTLQSLLPTVVIAPTPGNGVPINLTLPRPYDNMSVPGFTMADATQTLTGNVIIDLILRGQGPQAQQAAFLQPTFVSLWLGNNDVLGAATTGVAIDGQTLTTVAEFEAALAAIGQVFEAAGIQQGVIANIPNVTAIPFVTTVPPIVVDQTGNPVLLEGAPIPLIGETTIGIRPLVLGQDFVLLTALGELAQGRGLPPALGGTGPLSTFVVLDRDEVARIQERVNDFNAILGNAARDAGAALVDINTIFDEAAADGINIGGIEFTADFLTGGLFSYDGVHPTPLGYAIAANAFIAAINQTYSANIPPVNLGRFVFGPEGTLPGGQPLVASDLRITRRAWRNLRESLRLPSRRQLKKAMREERGLSASEARVERRQNRREWRRVGRSLAPRRPR